MMRFFSVFKLLFWAVAALLLVVVMINLRDEALDPEVTALLAEQAPQSVADNAYVYLQGMAAPQGTDPKAAGEKRLLLLAETDRADQPSIAASAMPLPAPGAKDGCEAFKRNCLIQVSEEKDLARAWLERHDSYAERCAEMERMPAWRETHIPTSINAPLPALQPLLSCQRIRFARAAVDLASGRPNAALARILNGLALERRALSGSATVLGKQVALSAAARSMLTLSDLASAAPETIRREEKAVRAALQPLTADERSQAAAFRNEFRSFIRFMQELEGKKGTIRISEHIGEHGAYTWLADTLLFSPGATINHQWKVRKAYLTLEAVPAGEFAAARQRADEALSALQARLTPGALYNPVGKVLSGTAVPDFAGYILRMHDLDALLRLAALQAEIVLMQDDKAIPALLAQARFADPYSGRPMAFDAGKKGLSFEPRALEESMQGSLRLVDRQLLVPLASAN